MTFRELKWPDYSSYAICYRMHEEYILSYVKNTKSKEWVVAQSVKHMLHKPKDLSSDTSNSHESQA